jgi:hypothetical protein
MMGAIRFRSGATLAALVLCVWGRVAHAGSVEVRCRDMPPAARDELASRIVATMVGAGAQFSTIGIECDSYGVWMVWFDGTRALIDQREGLVPGAVLLVQSRLSFDRGYAARAGVAEPIPDTPPRPDLELPPGDAPTPPDAAKSDRKKGTEGGIGLGMTTAFWGSSATGVGPRLDVSVGPPGPVAFLLAEGALFGTGSASSSQITVFDFQAGAAFGAPYKERSGFGGVALVGAERIAAANVRNDSAGLWEWNVTLDIGMRGGFKVAGVNVWAGADLLIRSSGFEVGGSTPVSIPTTSLMLSAGGFLPAFSRASSAN